MPTPVGTWIMAASPLVAEAMGHAGFDWCVIDMEHTPLDMMNLVHMLQAVAGTAMMPVVRVPWNDTVVIKRVLDAGATTLMVPFIQNAEEARNAVAATRYPPEGLRGVAAMSRGSKFGTISQYLTTANQGMCVVAQLETTQAIGELENIASVPGIDALFVGPADLSATMGYAGQPTHPQVLAVTAQAVARAKAVGIPLGTVGGTPEVVAQYLAMGFDFVAIASDLGLLMRSAQNALTAVRGTGNAPETGSGGY